MCKGERPEHGNRRRAETQLKFVVPARGLIGFRGEFVRPPAVTGT